VREDELVYLMITVIAGRIWRGAKDAILDVLCKYIVIYQKVCIQYLFELKTAHGCLGVKLHPHYAQRPAEHSRQIKLGSICDHKCAHLRDSLST